MKSWPKIDALILGELGVERADRLGVGVLVGEVGDRAAPDDVVDQHQPAAAHQGQQIGLLARAIGVRRAVEVGTFTGYSALCIAEALPDDGKLWCCDVSEEWTRIGKRYWKEAGLGSRIELTVAPALKTLDWLLAQGLGDQLDLAFIDADKTNYDAYYERCLKLVRRGGLLLIDNVIWGGSVANLADKDADTEAIRTLNAKLRKDERVDLTLFAVGDGMTCALKR